MKNWTFVLFLSLIMVMAGCSEQSQSSTIDDKVKIGVMLSDVGLGDQSFSDSAFYGLEQARDELGILFDYRELADVGDYQTGLTQLMEEDNDLIIGLGYMIEEDLMKVAEEYPDQQFVIVDSVIDLPNVTSVTFKEHEGSFLIGAIAGMKTESDIVGFVGGEDTPLIQKFLNGYKQGVAATNPDATVLDQFAGDFGDDQLGEEIAAELIEEGADYIYPSAGFTGVGVIKQAQEEGIYSFGVDSDQYYLGEDTVVTSMLKNIDVAMYTLATDLVENGELTSENLELGLSDDGVGLAPIRVLSLTSDEDSQLNELKDDINSNEITVNE
ncbi:BMP family ABC transporter substrate-binding protein [Gracilibacillus salitolerans]|uniref:BMP family ABC transporter substrate-binding protein n=1 Tax=Gracilibacillus salitolerans TaxID=2663022 RepID=A0A5Q2TFY5_9BACI|nr:BMP family ABC transporter substrate-binding protein [Gracilibacillus salitolerans]QGH33719.1 BMP family ABC transporter substrate-binding protein [Gracilibacillus salitolerans]